MKFPFSESKNDWPPHPREFEEPTPARIKFFRYRLTGLVAIFLFGFLIYAIDGAAWTKRLTMAMLFCGLIYMRDDSPSGRWVTIGIIAVGTALSILLPLLGIGVTFFRGGFSF
jgi:hypothetical protein